MSYSKPQIVVTNNFPKFTQFGADTILIYDKVLLKNVKFEKWVSTFPVSYGVQSGEKLKSIETFPIHIKKISALTEGLSARKLKVVAVGGGSVGDFAGFVASIYKRGVELYHIPSTWLAALDSAHGGKNGLNVSKAKNQLGTFYSPLKIYLVRTLLQSQPVERLEDACGELLKISLIDGGYLWKELQSNAKISEEKLLRMLPKAIEAKYRIVKKDPFEKKGIRHVLNLGHTMGHVFESVSEISHGQAVGYGLIFAAIWSRYLGLTKNTDYEKIIRCPAWVPFILSGEYERLLKINTDKVRQFLNKDKKKVSRNSVRFIFIVKPGKTIIREVKIEAIIKELIRQDKLLKAYYA